MEKPEQAQTIDLEVKAEQRKDNFIARTVAAVSGAVSGVLSFKALRKDAVRKYLERRLNNRDWINGALDEAGKPKEGADIIMIKPGRRFGAGPGASFPMARMANSWECSLALRKAVLPRRWVTCRPSTSV